MSDDKPTQPLPGVPGDAPDDGATQALPTWGETRRLPVAGPEDPLSVFDQPDQPVRPTERLPEPEPLPAPAPDPLPEPLPAPLPDPASPGAEAPTGAAAPVSTGPRASTIVWGFLVIAFGVGLLANAAGAYIDVELAAIVLLGAAGVLLLVGSVVSAARRRRSTRG